MTGLVFALLVASVAFLIFGLIKPKWAWLKSRRQVALIFIPISLLLFVGLGASVGSDDEPSASDAGDVVSESGKSNWYEGGTLHEATISEWLEASDADRLATAGDWSFGILGRDQARSMGLDALKLKATDLAVCVNKSVEGNDALLSQPAKGIAALCAVTMGWRTASSN